MDGKGGCPPAEWAGVQGLPCEAGEDRHWLGESEVSFSPFFPCCLLSLILSSGLGGRREGSFLF